MLGRYMGRGTPEKMACDPRADWNPTIRSPFIAATSSACGVANMIEWIVILLVVAAIASLLGFRGVAGVSAGIAKVLILIVLVGFLLLLFFGVIAFA